MNPEPECVTTVRNFLNNPQYRYLLGATPYAAGIASTISVQAIIDDLSQESSFQGVPVIPVKDAPPNAIVVTTTLGRPLTARRRLEQANLSSCDYFAFHKYGGLDLPWARFWTGFEESALNHTIELDMIRQLLVDSISLDTFNRIVNFRLTANLDYLSVFTDNQRNQYFEDFLRLNREGEVFADVGGFDGRTTLDFISKSPGFKEAHIFEPDPENFTTIKNVFRDELRVQVHNIGLGGSKGVARFSSSGSTSAITREGGFEVRIEKLDSLFLDELTFLKMDVEGAEAGALEGARETIARCKPRLAVAVYHNPDDVWQIPIKILSMNKDYDLYLRHYTEGVTETVMFFIPKQ